MSGESLEELTARMEGLDDASVSAHPDVLDRLHRALVEELENLAVLRTTRAGEAARTERS